MKPILALLVVASCAAPGTSSVTLAPSPVVSPPAPVAAALAAGSSHLSDIATSVLPHLGRGDVEQARAAIVSSRDPLALYLAGAFDLAFGKRAHLPFNLRVTKLAPPPFGETLHEDPSAARAAPLRLVGRRLAPLPKVNRHEPIYVPRWLDTRGQSAIIDERSSELFPVDAPLAIPRRVGSFGAIQHITDRTHSILIYGRNEPRTATPQRVIAAELHYPWVHHDEDSGRLVFVLNHDGRTDAAFDFSNYFTPPTQTIDTRREAVSYARAGDGVLYVQNWHDDVGARSVPENGYITAVAMPSGALLWRSAPRTSYGATFVLTPKRVLSLGGPTRRDHLYVLDRGSGRRIGSVALGFEGWYITREPSGAILVSDGTERREFPELAEPEPAHSRANTRPVVAPEPTSQDELRDDDSLARDIAEGRMAEALAKLESLELGPRAASLRVAFLRVYYDAVRERARSACGALVEQAKANTQNFFLLTWVPTAAPPVLDANRRAFVRTKHVTYEKLLRNRILAKQMPPESEIAPWWLPPHALQSGRIWSGNAERSVARIYDEDIVLFGAGVCNISRRISFTLATGVAKDPTVAPPLNPIREVHFVGSDLVGILRRPMRTTVVGNGAQGGADANASYLVRFDPASGAMRWHVRIDGATDAIPMGDVMLVRTEGRFVTKGVKPHVHAEPTKAELLAVNVETGALVANTAVPVPYSVWLTDDGTVRLVGEKDELLYRLR